MKINLKVEEKAFPGHEGRPGQVGGSAPRSGVGKVTSHKIDAISKIKSGKYGKNKYKVEEQYVSASMAMRLNSGFIDEDTFIAEYWGVDKPRSEDTMEYDPYDTSSRVMNILEGVNPDKPGHDTVLVNIGGNKSFISQYKPSRSYGHRPPTINEWSSSGDRYESKGSLTYWDPFTNEEFYVEQTSGGDWA